MNHDYEATRNEQSAFVSTMIVALPFLQALYTEHLADNFGNPLPYVFLGDVCHAVVESANIAVRLGTDNWQTHKNILDFLDVELQKHGKNDTPISNLIALGFAENVASFCQATSPFAHRQVWDFLLQKSPPCLSAEIQKFP